MQATWPGRHKMDCDRQFGDIKIESEVQVAGAGAEAGEDEAQARTTGKSSVFVAEVRMLAATLVSLGCAEVLARRILPHTAKGECAEGDTMAVLAQLSEEKIAGLFHTAAAGMAAKVRGAVGAWKAGTDAAEKADAGLGSGKFVDGKYGSLELFGTGLEGYVGLPDVNVFKAMKQEHASSEKFSPSNNQGTRLSTRLPDSDNSFFLIPTPRHVLIPGVNPRTVKS